MMRSQILLMELKKMDYIDEVNGQLGEKRSQGHQ